MALDLHQKLRLVPLDIFKPSSNYFTDPFYGGASFVDLFVIYVSCLSLLFNLVYSLQPCNHLLGKG